MKNKFIRTLSPITALVIMVLDVAVVYYLWYVIEKLTKKLDMWNVLFIIFEAFALVVAFLVSKNVLKQGVKFDEEKLEFTSLDDNNIFCYADIEKIESSKDTKASLRKNFVDRYSHIIFYLKDGNVVTVDLGLTTVRTLSKITDEINQRIQH